MTSAAVEGTRSGNANYLAEILDGTSWARGLSWEQVLRVAEYATLRDVSGGSTLIAEGARDGFLCIVVEGELEVVKENSRGERQVLARLHRGASLGEMSILDGEPRSASVVARTDTTLLVIASESLDRLARDAPGLGLEVFRRLGRVVSQRLRQTSGALVDAVLP